MVFPIMKKNISGGIIITQTDNSNNIINIIMGKSNNNLNTFENFGGHPSPSDSSCFHTAIREFIEEFFNFIPPISLIDSICNSLIDNSLVVAQIEFNGVSYLIDFSTVNLIFSIILQHIPDSPLSKYLINNQFDYKSYFTDRIITDKSFNGLNEIHSLHIIPINDVLKNKYKLRRFSKKIINLFF